MANDDEDAHPTCGTRMGAGGERIDQNATSPRESVWVSRTACAGIGRT
ncbi:hypothetical protein [Sphaerisporangium sp. TRM90804]|nr:hypothetical protein [Sphaerisporangium sp. TRM90804]MDH2428294.1 hypothetical protein [Sphaerisporangium sp. TRM90804]